MTGYQLEIDYGYDPTLGYGSTLSAGSMIAGTVTS